MLRDSKDMPKIQTIADKASIEKYGGSRMYFAPPVDYDTVMKKDPFGKVTTVGAIRDFFREAGGRGFHRADYRGIFRVNRRVGKSPALR